MQICTCGHGQAHTLFPGLDVAPATEMSPVRGRGRVRASPGTCDDPHQDPAGVRDAAAGTASQPPEPWAVVGGHRSDRVADIRQSQRARRGRAGTAPTEDRRPAGPERELRRPEARPWSSHPEESQPRPRERGLLAVAKNTLAQGAQKEVLPFTDEDAGSPRGGCHPAGGGSGVAGTPRSPALRPDRCFTANTHTADNQH